MMSNAMQSWTQIHRNRLWKRELIVLLLLSLLLQSTAVTNETEIYVGKIWTINLFIYFNKDKCDCKAIELRKGK